MAYVANAQPHEIASTQFAVDAEIEQGEFSQAALHLQANPDAPNRLQLERCLLPDQLALVPRVVMTNLCRFHRDLHSVEGDRTLRRPPARAFIGVKVVDCYDRC